MRPDEREEREGKKGKRHDSPNRNSLHPLNIGTPSSDRTVFDRQYWVSEGKKKEKRRKRRRKRRRRTERTLSIGLSTVGGEREGGREKKRGKKEPKCDAHRQATRRSFYPSTASRTLHIREGKKREREGDDGIWRTLGLFKGRKKGKKKERIASQHQGVVSRTSFHTGKTHAFSVGVRGPWWCPEGRKSEGGGN